MNWRHKIDISGPWKLHDDGKLTLDELANEIWNILCNSTCLVPSSLKTKFFKLKSKKHKGYEIEAFDSCMNKLYDWADANAVWINVF